MSLDEPNMLVLLVATIALQAAFYTIIRAIPAGVWRRFLAWLDGDATGRHEKVSGP
jgi:hypothetical protein